MLVQVGYGIEPFFERKCEIYYDTDELDDAEYYYYHKAKRLGYDILAKDILTKQITAYDIEHNKDYAVLAE